MKTDAELLELTRELRGSALSYKVDNLCDTVVALIARAQRAESRLIQVKAHAERETLRTAAQDVIDSWDHNGPDGIVSATRIERLRAALALGDKEV